MRDEPAGRSRAMWMPPAAISWRVSAATVGSRIQRRTEASGALDVRTLCLARETLARHDGLADFCFRACRASARARSRSSARAEQKRVAEKDPRRRGDRRLRADRAEIGLGCRQHRDDRCAGTAIAFASTARRPGFPTAASPTSTSSSREPGEAPGAKGLSAFLVPADTPGLSVTERLETIAPHPLARLTLRWRARPRFGADRKARRRLQDRHVGARRFPRHCRRRGTRLCPPRPRRDADACAERKLFGAPMAELQMVQGHIADMALDIDAAALLVYRAAWTKDMGAARVSREASMAKLFATDRAQERHRQGRAAAWWRRASAAARWSSGSIGKSARSASTRAHRTCRRS